MKEFFTKVISFLKNVVADQRIPDRDKKVLTALVFLILSPLDLIPDWLPIIGQLDDIVMLALILDYFFTVLDSEVLLSHWPWGMKSFAHLRRVSRALSWIAPRFLKKQIWKYVGSPY